MESWSHLQARWAWWQRCLPGVYTKLPWYHWSLKIEPVDSCQCDHRWYSGYQKTVKSFLDHLASQMDHTVSQWYQIYQLEDVWIKAGETQDELVDCLRALANRCNFPTDEEKEWNIHFCLVHALTDRKLVRKLLAPDLTATTAKMLKTCRTQIATADNLNAIGLRSKTVNAVNKQSQWPWPHPQQQQKTLNSQNQHVCGNCTKSHAPSRASCPAKESTCWSCGRIGHWDVRSQSTSGKQKDPNKNPPWCWPKGGKQKQTHTVDVGDDYNPQCNEVHVITIDVQPQTFMPD